MAGRILGPKGRRRRTRLLVLLPAFVLVGLLAAILAFATVSSDSGFEGADGNLAPNGGTPNFDWNSFAPVTWDGTAPNRTATKVVNGWSFKGFEDAFVSTTDNAFAGGTKQDADCATVGAGKAPNKDDLKRIYLATKTVGGEVFLALAWIRIPQNSTTASAHVGFEFNKGATSCGIGSPLVRRTSGDMLVVYDFAGGSAAPLIKLSRWLTPGFDPYPTDGIAPVCEVTGDPATTAGCWGHTKELTASGVAEGRVNHDAAVTDDIKPTNGGNPGLVEFGEAVINLSDAGVFGANQCEGFGRAYAVSRSSGNSAQAAMKDLVGPGPFTIANCATLDVTKTNSDGSSPAGAVFTLYEGSDTTGDVVGTCTVQADGSCDPQFTGLNAGTYTIDETTVPSGFDKDADLPHTFTLTLGQNATLSFENVAQPGSAAISKVDDDGDPVEGAVFTVYSPAGIQNGAPTGTAVDSCETDADGECTISGLTPGTYTIDETVPDGYAKDSSFPKNITITNGGTTPVAATNPRLFKTIVIVCREYDDSLYPSAITIDGQSAGDSISASQATTAGLTEAELCGITQGDRSGLRAAPHTSNPHDADIDIPNSQP